MVGINTDVSTDVSTPPSVITIYVALVVVVSYAGDCAHQLV